MPGLVASGTPCMLILSSYSHNMSRSLSHCVWYQFIKFMVIATGYVLLLKINGESKYT